MRQIPAARLLAPVICLVLLSCDQAKRATSVKHPTVASLVPAATDMIVGIGANEHLLAVSNFDNANPNVRNLPRVGDYQNTDWEKLAQIRPDVIIIQMNENSVPQGLRDHAREIGSELVNLKIQSLDDLRTNMLRLGEITGESQKAKLALDRFNQRLEAVKSRSKETPPLRTLIILDPHAQSVIGPHGFIDGALTIAGGRNAAASLNQEYADIDREKLLFLDPQVVIALLPDFNVPSEEIAASLPEISAKKNKRVYVLKDWYLLLPGFHLADLAEQLQNLLQHGKV